MTDAGRLLADYATMQPVGVCTTFLSGKHSAQEFPHTLRGAEGSMRPGVQAARCTGWVPISKPLLFMYLDRDSEGSVLETASSQASRDLAREVCRIRSIPITG